EELGELGDDARVGEPAGGDQRLDAGVDVDRRRLARVGLSADAGGDRRRGGELDQRRGGRLGAEEAEDADRGARLAAGGAVLERLEERLQAALADALELLLRSSVAAPAARAVDQRRHGAVVDLDEDPAVGALSGRGEGERRQVLL